jgi:hypothetical protein
MSLISNKKYIFLYAFTERVDRLSSLHEISAGNISQLPTISRENLQPGGRTEATFGIENGLSDIMEKIYSLHINSKALPNLESRLIVDAVEIWKDLDELKPQPPLDNGEYSDLHASCVSALYAWLYLVIHPNGIQDEKLQSVVRDGLASTEHLDSSGVSPFLFIPAFCLGLAAINQDDRSSVNELFEDIGNIAAFIDISPYRGIVERSWRRWDRGDKRSWDWTD